MSLLKERSEDTAVLYVEEAGEFCIVGIGLITKEVNAEWRVRSSSSVVHLDGKQGSSER